MDGEVLEGAKRLYEDGNSLAAVGEQLGFEASTVGKALKRAGVELRQPIADRWRGSRDES